MAIVGNIGHFDNEIQVAALTQPQVDQHQAAGRHDRVPRRQADASCCREGRLAQPRQRHRPSELRDVGVASPTRCWRRSSCGPSRGQYENKVYVLPKHLDEKVARLHLAKLGVQADRAQATSRRPTSASADGPVQGRALPLLRVPVAPLREPGAARGSLRAPRWLYATSVRSPGAATLTPAYFPPPAGGLASNRSSPRGMAARTIAAGRMAKGRAERDIRPHRMPRRRAALRAGSALPLASTARGADLLRAFARRARWRARLLVWWAVTARDGARRSASVGLLLRARRDDAISMAERQVVSLRSPHDRAVSLLDADDQRTVVWDKATSEPEVFGGLPERVGAPGRTRRVPRLSRPGSAPKAPASLDAAVDKLRRDGGTFQLALRTSGGSAARGERTHQRTPRDPAPARADRRAPFLRRAEGTGGLRHRRDERRCARSPTCCRIPLWRRNRTGRLTWVNAAYARAVEAENQEAVLTSRHRASAAPHARGDPRGDAPRAAPSTKRRRDRRRRAPAVERARRADRGRHGRRCALDVSEVESVRQKLNQATESNARILDRLAAGVAVFGRDGQHPLPQLRLPRRSGASPPNGSHRRPRRARSSTSCAPSGSCRSRRTTATGGQSTSPATRAPRRARTLAPARRAHAPRRREAESEGGMSYIYENVTERIDLESRYNALIQRAGRDARPSRRGRRGVRLATAGCGCSIRPSPTSGGCRRRELRRRAAYRRDHRDLPAIGRRRADVGRDPRARVDRHRRRRAQALGRMERRDGSVDRLRHRRRCPTGRPCSTFVDVTDRRRSSARWSSATRRWKRPTGSRTTSSSTSPTSCARRSPTSSASPSSCRAETRRPAQRQAARIYGLHHRPRSRALLAIVNDILDLATVDAGIMELDIAEVDIAETVDGRGRGTARPAERAATSRSTSSAAATSARFHADAQARPPDPLQPVSNAIGFSNAGRHTSASAAGASGDFVVFTVDGRGRGIPRAMLPQRLRPLRDARRAGAARRRRPRPLDREELRRAARRHVSRSAPRKGRARP